MTTLRERVKEALAAHEPDARDARSDLDAVLARSGRRRPWWPWLAVPAVAAVAVVVVARRPPPAPPPVAARSGEDDGVHLYLHVHGEPEGRALALDVQTRSKGTSK